MHSLKEQRSGGRAPFILNLGRDADEWLSPAPSAVPPWKDTLAQPLPPGDSPFAVKIIIYFTISGWPQGQSGLFAQETILVPVPGIELWSLLCLS